MPKRLSRQFIVALWGLAAACNGLAMGFGPMPESVAFGRPLDLLVSLNTAPGEALEAACLSAQVDIGERRLPAGAVQVVAEPADAASTSRRLRIQSLQVVDEPVVGISVSAGCRDKVTRQFTVFADPADRAAPPSLVAALPGKAALPSVQPVRAVPGAAPGASSSQPSARSARPTAERVGVKPTEAQLQLDRADNARPVAVTPVSVALDEAMVGAVAAQAAASAATPGTATTPSSATPSVATQHVVLMERDMPPQAAASAHQDTAAQSRARVGEAESQGPWVPLLAVLLAVVGGVALWLGGRVRTLQRERQAGGAVALPPPVATEVPAPSLASMSSTFDGASTIPRALAKPSSWVSAASSEQAAAPLDVRETSDPQAAALSAKAVAKAQAAPPPRPMSVDELIDLEQRAEFFGVLGQDESAIDLLMAHLRGSGGVSPLPYLQLLEIYRRRDERGAYERTRTRFNYRFSAHAPDWDHDPQQGRTLLDHDDVVLRLQTAWRTPVDAMAELEDLLFCKAGDELFDLPAYRDVMVLYAVARDLNKRAGAASTANATAADVDVWLPLPPEPRGANGEDWHLHKHQHAHLHAPAFGDADVSHRPTAAIDLDLNEPPSSLESAFSVLSPITVSR